MSLYNYICLRYRFPTGRKFRRFLGDDIPKTDMQFLYDCFCLNGQKLEGCAQIICTPPKHCKFPILYTKIRDHLVAPICFACATSQQKTTCDHNAKQRSFSSTFCFPEINKAQLQGYEIEFVELYVTTDSDFVLADFIRNELFLRLGNPLNFLFL